MYQPVVLNALVGDRQVSTGVALLAADGGGQAFVSAEGSLLHALATEWLRDGAESESRLGRMKALGRCAHKH